MEAFQSGSFQRNMDEMFRINGLPRVIFPENIVTEGIKDLYRDTMQKQGKQMQQEGNKETEKTAEEVTQTKEMEGATALDPEEMEIESIKRTRETSQTSPQIGQEMKKRGEEEESARDRLSMRTNENTKPNSATIEQTRAAPPVPPKPPRESSVGRDGERTDAREKGKTRPSERRELSATRQQPKVNIRDVGIVVYFKKSSRYNI